jgi:ABC-type multidrug transport system fused ATPase/permease subunit
MENRRILAQDSFENIKKDTMNLALEDVEDKDKKDKREDSTEKVQNKEQNEKQKEVKETLEAGSVQFEVYLSYMKAVKNPVLVALVIVFMIIAQAASSGVDYFVAIWVNWEESLIVPLFRRTTEEIRDRYVMVYGILVAILVYMTLQKTFSFFYLCLRVSKNLHDQMFRGIIRASMYFFNTNSSGRILNRFSKDIGTIDSTLPTVLQHSIAVSLLCDYTVITRF